MEDLIKLLVYFKRAVLGEGVCEIWISSRNCLEILSENLQVKTYVHAY